MSTPPCTAAVFFDAQHFRNLIDRIYPPGYLEPLQSPGPGYEVLRAYALIGERLSLATARMDCGLHILDSFGAAFATVVVDISRADTSTGVLVVKKGTVVTTSNGGRDFVTQTDLAFGALDVGPFSTLAIATEPDFVFEVPGLAFAADGTPLPGDIDTVKTLLLDVGYPATGTPNFAVTNPLQALGGKCPMLDGLGADRGLPRNPGETDAQYKVRIRTLPDTVSPGAILRAVNNYLSAFCNGHLTFDFIETWQATYQTCFDCPSPNVGTPTYSATLPPGINTDLFTYDDPRPAYPPFRNRWLSEEDFRGAFIIVLPDIAAVTDVGFAYDDTAAGPLDLVTDCGYRSVGAYDIPAGYSASSPGGYDGFDLGKQAMYRGLADLLEKIKAGGVLAAVERRGE